MLSNGLINIQCWSDYAEKGVGFNIGKHLKMTLYAKLPYITPISHLSC